MGFTGFLTCCWLNGFPGYQATLHRSFLEQKLLPRILNAAYYWELRVLQNKLQPAKFLCPVFEIWEPRHPIFGNPEKLISYSCIIDDADTDSDACLIFRVTIYIFYFSNPHYETHFGCHNPENRCHNLENRCHNPENRCHNVKSVW